MITDINQVFALLDEELYKISDTIHTITICGGATMMFFDRRNSTNDVDVLDGVVDEEMKLASLEVAKKLQLKENWLNSSSNSFKYCYSDGWEKRVGNAFTGKALIVNSISREDLLQSKFYAFIDRGFDFEDLISLRPTRKEVIRLMKVAFANPKNVSQGKKMIVLETKSLLTGLGHEDLKDDEI